MIGGHLSNEVRKTVEGFGWQWHKFSDQIQDTYMTSKTNFLDFIYPVTEDFFKHKFVLDAGCGMGRFLKLATEFGSRDVIGVDLSPAYSRRQLYSGLDVMFHADWIKSCYLNKLNLKFCDWVISPPVVKIAWPEFSRAAFCVRQGESASLRNIEGIKRALAKKRRSYFWRKFFPGLQKGERYVD